MLRLCAITKMDEDVVVSSSSSMVMTSTVKSFSDYLVSFRNVFDSQLRGDVVYVNSAFQILYF